MAMWLAAVLPAKALQLPTKCRCNNLQKLFAILCKKGLQKTDYCKWCYADGEFKYSSKEQLIDFCVEHMATEEWPAEQVRAHMESVVPGLKHWK